MDRETRVQSKCCRADIVYLPGNDEGECAKCSSPSFRITDDAIELFEGTPYTSLDFTQTEKYYLLGMQRAANETSEMDAESFEDEYYVSL
jgi:hypothetical protein